MVRLFIFHFFQLIQAAYFFEKFSVLKGQRLDQNFSKKIYMYVRGLPTDQLEISIFTKKS